MVRAVIVLVHDMKICYITSPYPSFARIARLYSRVISKRHTMVKVLADAELVILHCEPHRYPAIYAEFPILSTKYTIGYAVWEATRLPRVYRDGLRLVQEIWTPSRYCMDIFRREHGNVQIVPHPMYRDRSYTEDDMAKMKLKVSYDEGLCYLLAITRTADSRKNVRGLLDAFARFHAVHRRCRLIVKTWGQCPTEVKRQQGVIVVDEWITDGELNALYSIASLYVSIHHAEGWGLAIADAVIFGLPVVATEYSGNLDYLTGEDAYLVHCEVKTIEPGDRVQPFDETMMWAYCDSGEIFRSLNTAYDELSRGFAQAKAKVAATNAAARFGVGEIALMIWNRLNVIDRCGLHADGGGMPDGLSVSDHALPLTPHGHRPVGDTTIVLA